MPPDVPRAAPPAPAAAPTGVALRAAKRALRERVLDLRDALDAHAREEAARLIAGRIAGLPSFAAARHVLATLPFRNEWDTRALIASALASGKRVALPRVDERTRMLALFAVTDIDADVAPGFKGIAEPCAHCVPVPLTDIDWILVPGVAFDAGCRRLGYGGGFYDRMLPLVAPGVARVAGAFDVQIVQQVPAAPHDVGVDAVVTESRTYTR